MKCKQHITFSANGKAYSIEKNIPITLESDEVGHIESKVLNIYPEIEYQRIDGFGVAITETSAYLISKMKKEERQKILEEYFGKAGNSLNFIRVHMDSCDYSLSEYAAVEKPLEDPELSTFSLKRDQQYILPILHEIIRIADKPLSVLLSPWSPPADWKTPPEKPKNDLSVYGAELGFQIPPVDYEKPSRCNGGKLKPKFYPSWAKYLTKYVEAYIAEGIPVTMMSIQNETIAATMWDSCIWTAQEQKEFLKEHLYPEFEKAGFVGKVGIYIWDHNKERVLEFASEIIDLETDKMVEGIAFHWYSGDHFEAVEMTNKKYPNKVLMMSECCGLHPPGKSGFMGIGDSSKLPATAEYEDALAYAHDIIGNLNAGMNRWIDWNLCVDETGGPRHVLGGFTASAVVQKDFTYIKNLTYDYIGHFSKYIHANAVRIGYSRCDDKIEMTAVRNLDGTIVLVILNKMYNDQQYSIRLQGKIIRIQIPAQTISTVICEIGR